MTYYWNIFNCKALLENEDIFTFITLLETLEKKYNYIEKLVVTPITKPEIVKLVISKTALEEAHIPVIAELKKKQGCDDVTIKNNKFYIKHLHLDKIKDEGLKFLCIKMDTTLYIVNFPKTIIGLCFENEYLLSVFEYK